ncbi:hypothetical protein GWI33_007697 [Rhynchophorus ferrugineus]|uniref:Uncharacterized protein n=1 Tax=Rhynchophorus ferrugineus TaxID=354439 RepID=A0A834IFT9_RHYFE|nr:hypothetical protein GWI33_007697 [Rhynchophorus ferrugineus]
MRSPRIINNFLNIIPGGSCRRDIHPGSNRPPPFAAHPPPVPGRICILARARAANTQKNVKKNSAGPKPDECHLTDKKRN